MPITFTIEQEVIFTEARGILSYADVLDHISAKETKEVFTLPELFDARDVTLDLSVEDLKAIAAAVAKSLNGRSPGRTAVVMNSAFLFGLARSYADLTKVMNPDFEVFYDFDEARAWIFSEAR